MLNFFQNAEISIDYDFEHIEIPQNFEKIMSKKYIFISPYGKETANYATNPYAERVSCTQTDEEFLDNVSNETITDIQLNDFEKELMDNSEQTKTIFYPDGKFETNLPSGEIYENKFDDISIAPYYLEELSIGFEDIKGFGVEYFDKTINLHKKWLVMFDENKNEYYLHGLENNSKQTDTTYKGNKNDFKTMISAIIQDCCEYELQTAIFYQ